MAASGAPERRPRRGPAPIASFDHDVSDESSPDTKQTFRLPEIREDPSSSSRGGNALAPPEQRARSHSSPAVHGGAASGLQTPATPRIDISRASSSSHHDSRDSSPELALFAGGSEEGRARLELGFREDGALDLRSSTEELAFLEGAPGEARAPPAPSVSRRHSRKDSQSSEVALLAVSGRTSRISSVGSQCSAHSALSAFSHASRVSHLSVVSGASRSPSPHKMLLETSFCGPKPIETDPEICAAAVEERLLEIAKLTTEPLPLPVLVSPPSSTPLSISVTPTVSIPVSSPPSSAPASTSTLNQEATPDAVDARDRREVRTEVTLESARPVNVPRLVSPAAPVITTCTAPSTPASCSKAFDEEKRQKETRNRARVEEGRARSRERREPSQPEVYRSSNRSKNIIRIKLKPDHEYDDDDQDESERTLVGGEPARKPATLELQDRAVASSPAQQRRHRDSRTPSPLGAPVSRKSSFCSLFKSRETIASPDSPCDVLRRKKSLNEGRSRSKSRDRSTTPTSTSKIRGSVLSLFKTPRKSATSPSPSSRDGSPIVQPQRQFPQQHVEKSIRSEKLKYYEDSKDGVIHIPLRTPPDESSSPSAARPERREQPTAAVTATSPRESARPASAPQPRILCDRPISVSSTGAVQTPIKRTVLPDGSIIIPLHSPTEMNGDGYVSTSNVPLTPETSRCALAVEPAPPSDDRSNEHRFDTSTREVKANVEQSSGSTTSDATRFTEEDHRKRRERIVFTTHVGSRDQVFSTQFSITKTPSVTSEISESIPSFVENDEVRMGLRDTHITSAESPLDCERPSDCERPPAPEPQEETTCSAPGSPHGEHDSSESEPSSEVAPARSGNEVERRGLVVQESFEEELPYVPTTLPLERSLALPMVPVRERSGVRVAGLQRPRAPRGPVPAPPPPRAPPPPPRAPPAPVATSPRQLDALTARPPPDKLRIRLPRRTRTASASAPPRPERPRTRSGGDEILAISEMRKKAEWIDFEDVPERRKQPKRIQTLPAAEAAAEAAPDAAVDADAEADAEAGGAGLLYVEPEHCRCECHARRDDELPLLPDDDPLVDRSGAGEPGEVGARVQLSVQLSRPARRRLRADHTAAPH